MRIEPTSASVFGRPARSTITTAIALNNGALSTTSLTVWDGKCRRCSTAWTGGDDFYFDRINQIRMPCWSRGRVTLVGDAGYCVSPLAGFGGSMAIIGAGRLADALERYPDDHAAAFRHYENELRPFVEEVQ